VSFIERVITIVDEKLCETAIMPGDGSTSEAEAENSGKTSEHTAPRIDSKS